MQDVIKRDILDAIRQVVPALKKGNSYELNKLSNVTLHNAGVFQDQDSIAVGVLVYSLSKIYDRPRLRDKPALEKLRIKVVNHLKEAQRELQQNQLKGYNRWIKKIFQDIGSFEKKFGMYITEALKQAKIKKGGRVYEHGISAGKAASLMGVSKWDLMSYLGATKLHEKVKNVVSIDERVSLARRLFKI